MRRARAITGLLIAITLPFAALAQQTEGTGAPPQMDSLNAAKQSEDRAFAFKKMADEAEALQRLCATNFGPPDLCLRAQQRPEPAAPAAATAARVPGPGLVLNDQWSLSLVGWADKPTAWLRAPGAPEQRRAVKGSTIAGWTVDVVSKDNVRLSRPLLSADGAPVKDQDGNDMRETMTLLPSRIPAPPAFVSVGGYAGGAARANAPAQRPAQPAPATLLQPPTRVGAGPTAR